MNLQDWLARSPRLNYALVKTYRQSGQSMPDMAATLGLSVREVPKEALRQPPFDTSGLSEAQLRPNGCCVNRTEKCPPRS